METPSVPGMPNKGELMELLTNPDYNIKGVLVLDGDNLPPDRTIGRIVRTKITTPGGYVTTEFYSRRLVVVDKSRPELFPKALTESEDNEHIQSRISRMKYDIWINLLTGGDDGELGEDIRRTLMEPERCYDKEQSDMVAGYHDPENNNEARPGEQRSYVVISGS